MRTTHEPDDGFVDRLELEIGPKLHESLAQNPRYAACAHQSDSLFGTNPTSFFSEVTQAETARAHHE